MMDDITTPASKTDITLLRTDIALLTASTGADIAGLKVDIEELRQKMSTKADIAVLADNMEKGFKSVNEAIDKVLMVMTNVDKKTWSCHERSWQAHSEVGKGCRNSGACIKMPPKVRGAG